MIWPLASNSFAAHWSMQSLVDRTGPVPVALAITGGTGAYQTAHGQLETSGRSKLEMSR